MNICHRAPQAAQLNSPLSSIRAERCTCQTSGNDGRSASTNLINLDARLRVALTAVPVPHAGFTKQ